MVSVTPYSPSVLLRSLRFGVLGLLGVTTGVTAACVVSVGDSDWNGGSGACYEHYEDCLDDAWPFGDKAIGACEHLLDTCIDENGTEGGDTDDDGGSGGSSGDDSSDSGSSNDSGSSSDGGSDDGSDPPRADDGGDGDPTPDTTGDGDGDPTPDTTGDGDGDGPNPECFDLYGACVAAAETIQDVETCEALFDDCIDPGPCQSCEEPGCPQDDLDACVDAYAGCAAIAETEADADVCASNFDACIAQFDVSLCLPSYDDALVAECLEQHQLCIACADDASEIDACKVTFDNCLEG